MLFQREGFQIPFGCFVNLNVVKALKVLINPPCLVFIVVFPIFATLIANCTGLIGLFWDYQVKYDSGLQIGILNCQNNKVQIETYYNKQPIQDGKK